MGTSVMDELNQDAILQCASLLLLPSWKPIIVWFHDFLFLVANAFLMCNFDFSFLL